MKGRFLMVDENFLKNVEALLRMHEEGLLGGEFMPEDVLVGVVPKEDMPNVLTLGMALDYQRSAYALWESVAKAYDDEKSRWVFKPRVVTERHLGELRHILMHHRVALQPNRHPEIWHRVCQGITRISPSGDIMGLIELAEFDIAVLKEIIQEKRKSDFPYLSGPKIFNYWLYVMETYGGVKWKSRELITIAPDTHVLKATVKLGLCSPQVLKGSASDRETVAKAWEEALRGSEFAPIDVHTLLWLWSRAGFPDLEI